jgi:hypothetical protein
VAPPWRARDERRTSGTVKLCESPRQSRGFPTRNDPDEQPTTPKFSKADIDALVHDTELVAGVSEHDERPGGGDERQLNLEIKRLFAESCG